MILEFEFEPVQVEIEDDDCAFPELCFSIATASSAYVEAIGMVCLLRACLDRATQVHLHSLKMALRFMG